MSSSLTEQHADMETATGDATAPDAETLLLSTLVGEAGKAVFAIGGGVDSSPAEEAPDHQHSRRGPLGLSEANPRFQYFTACT